MRTGRSIYGLLWDMNVLFEEYFGRMTARALEPAGLKVDLQSGARHLKEDNGLLMDGYRYDSLDYVFGMARTVHVGAAA